MKKTNSFFKRLTSAVLSLVIVITSFAVVDFSKSASIEAKADSDEYFLMAYFTGDGDATTTTSNNQAIRFAVSDDGIRFSALNNNKPIIEQTGGTKNVRDPYIFQGNDGYYYLIGTDLNAATMGFWGNQPQMVIWRSSDLLTWDNETYINTAQICGLNDSQVYRTWAPQVFYDETSGNYMVYFAFAADGYNSTTMYYMLTDNLLDQSHYSTPVQLYNPGADDIDADITYQNGVYYMFYKDETTGRSTICLATATNLTGPYSYVGQLTKMDETGALEGCEVYTIDGNYYLMADRYGDNGKFAIYNLGNDLSAIHTSDGDKISVIDGNPISTVNATSGFSNLSVRHGSVIHINKAQYDALIRKYGGSTSDDIMFSFDKSYSAENSWHYDNIKDASGYSFDLMTNSGQYSYIFPQSQYVSLNGGVMFCNDSHIKEFFDSSNPWTVSFDVSIVQNRNSTLFAICSGDSPAGSTDWVRFLDNGELYVYNGGYNKVGSTSITTSVDYHFTLSYDGTYIVLYKNGEKVITSNVGSVINYDKSKSTSPICFGWTDTIGVTSVNAAYSHVRFRNRAVTEAEAKNEFSMDSNKVFEYDPGTDTVDGRSNCLYANGQVSTTYHGKRGASFAVSSWINIGANKNSGVLDGNNAVLFEIGAGGTGNGKNYFCILEDGRFRYCWSEGSTPRYVDVASVYTFDVNTWYFLQINVIPDGDQYHIRIFINGESVTDVTSGYNSMRSYDYGPINMLSQEDFPLYFGKGNAYWNGAGYNLTDNFAVYNRAVDPAELYRNVEIEDIADDARDYVRANLESYNVDDHTANRPAYHYTNEAVGGYNSVLAQKARTTTDSNNKDSNASTVNKGNANNGGLRYNLFWPAQIVLMYDGVNTPALPVTAEVLAASRGNKTMTTLVVNEDAGKSPDFTFAHYWTGYIDSGSNAWRTWPGTSMPYNFPDDPSTLNGGKSLVTDGRSHIGYRWGTEYDWSYTFNNTGTSRFFWNRCRYIGTPNTSTYYEYYDNIICRAWQDQEREVTSANHDIWVINYKPIYDILKSSNPTAMPHGFSGYGIKAMYTNFIKNNESNWTEDSLNHFYYAAYKVLTCNPMDYSEAQYQANFSSTVTQAANEIKQAVEEFNNINLKARANFSDLDTAYSSANSVIDTLGTNSQAKTTTSINALNDVISGLTYAPDDGTPYRPNLDADTYQDDIDAERTTINNAITALDQIFDFDTAYSYNATTWPVATMDIVDDGSPVSYNTMRSMAGTAVAKLGTENQNKTTSSLTTLQSAYNALTYYSYSDEAKKDLGVKKDGPSIAAEIDLVADSYLSLEDLLSYETVDAAYATGDATLKAISAEAPKYTTASVNALITAVTTAKSDATASRATRLDNAWSSPKQSAIDDKGRAISSAIENLEVVPEDVTDISAYEAAVENFEAIMNNVDSDIYESTSFTPENAAIELGEASDNTSYTVGGNTYTIYTIDNSADQTKIESATSNLVSYITSHYKQYKIYLEKGTFAVSADAKLKGGIVEESGSDEFGIYSYTGYANTEIVATANVDTAWYMSYTSAGTARSKQYQNYGKTFTNPLIGNMHIFAAQRTNKTPNKVTIRRHYSDNSASPTQCVDFVNTSYTVPTAPAIPFYTFTGYTYGGNTYGTTNDNKTISGITDDIVIIANYEKAATNEYAVKVSSVGDDGDIFNDSAEYNQMITVSDPSAAGWVINPDTANEKLFYVGSSFTFYVCESVEIKGIASLGSYTTPNVNLSPAVTSGGKTSIVGQIVGNNANIVEYGILVGKSKNGSTLGENDLILKNTGNHDNYSILRAKATKLVGANQFSIGVTGMPAGTYQYRSYLVYEDENELITVYSDVLSTTVA